MDIEKRTQDIGHELFDSISGEVPSFFDSKKWKGRIMEWAMKNEAFKIELFRFVDALPALKHEREIPALVSEYFFKDLDILPPWLERWIPKGRLLGTGAGIFIKKNVESLARQFIAGQDPADAIKTIKKLRKEGRTFSIDLLGEAVLSEAEASEYRARCIELIDSLSESASGWDEGPQDRNHKGPIPKADISLKISSFYPRLDPMAWDNSVKSTVEAMSPVIKRAIEKNISITLDMEHYQFKDISLEIFRQLLEVFPDLEFPGIAIQAYLKDTEEDLHDLIHWIRDKKRTISVRLVKGAYWDYEKVVNGQEGWPLPTFSSKAETDACYERMTLLLLENTDVIRPAIASHNIRSISKAIALAEELGLPKEAIEFQALFGMAEPVKNAICRKGFRLREYLPVGLLLPGMAYFVRRLLENTSNESFLRLSFAEKCDRAKLLAKPEAGTTPSPMEEGSFRNTPLTDFSDSVQRKSFEEAIKGVRDFAGSFGKIPCIVAGKKFTTEKEILSLSPANPEELVSRASSAEIKDLERSVEYAREKSAKWGKVPAEERAEYLFRAAHWMEERRNKLAAIQVIEVGKSWREADADVAEALDFLYYYGREIKKLCKPEQLGRYPGEMNIETWQPWGVAAVIAPWNFPLAIACGMTAASIAAGNCTILKPSSISPLSTYMIAEAFEAAGLPDGVLQFLPGSGAVIGQGLVEHKGIDLIAFTGSMEVGLEIVKKAGETKTGQRNVKKVIAEMGGKNAIIVDGTADMDEAVKGVAASFTGFQGQKCSACSRVIVIGDIMEDFLGRLTEAVKTLPSGDPQDPAASIGPLADKSSFEKVKKYIEIGKQEAEPHYIRESFPEKGYYAGPAIFSKVSPNCTIAVEEIFGPVLAVIAAKDFDEALDIANSTDFALTGGLYSRSPENIERAGREFMVGNLYINRKITGALVGRQPFGGFKMSGLGSKAGGREYLLNFMHSRVVTENTLRRGFAPEN